MAKIHKETVLRFLQEWLSFSDAQMLAKRKGVDIEPHSQQFSNYDGLCRNLQRFVAGSDWDFIRACHAELAACFYHDGLDSTFPFGQRSFGIRFDRNTQALCPNRRRWVKATIKRLTEELQHETAR